MFNLLQYKKRRQELRNHATQAEIVLWRYLRKSRLGGYKFRRQQGIGHYIVDFYCPGVRLVIEIDGDSHCDPTQKAFDAARQCWMGRRGIRTIRFTNHEVYCDIEQVLRRILIAARQ